MNIDGHGMKVVSYEVVGDRDIWARQKVWIARKLDEIGKTHPALVEHVRQNPAEFKTVYRAFRRQTETRTAKRSPKRRAGVVTSSATSVAFLPAPSAAPDRGEAWQL